MYTKKLYISVIIIIITLILALLGWFIFVGIQQRNLKKNSTDVQYFSTLGGTRTKNNSFFSGIVNSIKKDKQKPKPAVLSLRPKVQQIYSLPIAGYATLADSSIFVERATGNILSKNTNSATTTRVSKTTIPQVYRAFFVQNGTGVIRQLINTRGGITSIYNSVLAKSSTSTPLSKEIQSLVTSPDSTKIAYMEKTSTGSALVTSLPDGTKKNTLFTSILRGWNIDWQGETILLTQKASGFVPGSAYLVNPRTGAVTLALRQLLGLTTILSHDGTKILYSTTSVNKTPVLGVYDIKKRKKRSLYIYGLAEKCVWDVKDADTVVCGLPKTFPKNTYPDDWYQGAVHFQDNLWSINVVDTSMNKIIDLDQRGTTQIDVSSLTSKDGALLFINHTDKTLWGVFIPMPPTTVSTSTVPQ